MVGDERWSTKGRRMNSWRIGRSRRETWRCWMTLPVLAGLDWLFSSLFGDGTTGFLMTTLMWRRPGLAGVFPALHQCIETPPLFRGQPGG